MVVLRSLAVSSRYIIRTKKKKRDAMIHSVVILSSECFLVVLHQLQSPQEKEHADSEGSLPPTAAKLTFSRGSKAEKRHPKTYDSRV